MSNTVEKEHFLTKQRTNVKSVLVVVLPVKKTKPCVPCVQQENTSLAKLAWTIVILIWGRKGRVQTSSGYLASLLDYIPPPGNRKNI